VTSGGLRNAGKSLLDLIDRGGIGAKFGPDAGLRGTLAVVWDNLLDHCEKSMSTSMSTHSLNMSATNTPKHRGPFLAAGLFLLLLACPSALSAQEAQKQGLPVEGIKVSASVAERELSAVGTLSANESVVIVAEIAGRVQEIRFSEGQSVKAGQVLVRLDQAVLSAQRDRAQAALVLSRANLKRTEALFDEEAMSQRERDESTAKWKLDEADLRLAEAQLAKTEIRAPFAGVVGLRSVSQGAYMQPGQPIATLTDTDPLKVDFRVPERFSEQVKAGLAVQVGVDAVPGRVFSGSVYAVDPQVDVNGRSLMARARVANKEGLLKPGMFARIVLILEQRQEALMIPEEALVPRGAAQMVYKVVDGKVEIVPVVTGMRQKGRVEVVQGLKPGDTVITAGQIKVQPGMPVTVIPSAAAKAE
jgi:membrane fusion protein, multidrug efflux system